MCRLGAGALPRCRNAFGGGGRPAGTLAVCRHQKCCTVRCWTRCSFLAGTGVDPALPRCLNRSSMSNVSVHSERGEPVGKVTAAGAAAASARQAQRTRSQHAAAVGALLAALAALTAATAGLAQLRGRRARGQLDRQPLLPARRPGGPECRRLHTGEQQPAELALQQLPGRAARLQALLLSQAPAAGGGLASIELTPMRALSAGFQHRLGSARAAVTAARPAHVPRESALPSSASEAPAVAPSRQWGLATTSLQLEQEELQARLSREACCCTCRRAAGCSAHRAGGGARLHSTRLASLPCSCSLWQKLTGSWCAWARVRTPPSTRATCRGRPSPSRCAASGTRAAAAASSASGHHCWLHHPTGV